jgi:hypothetical protein
MGLFFNAKRQQLLQENGTALAQIYDSCLSVMLSVRDDQNELRRCLAADLNTLFSVFSVVGLVKPSDSYWVELLNLARRADQSPLDRAALDRIHDSLGIPGCRNVAALFQADIRTALYRWAQTDTLLIQRMKGSPADASRSALMCIYANLLTTVCILTDGYCNMNDQCQMYRALYLKNQLNAIQPMLTEQLHLASFNKVCGRYL